MHLYNSNFLKNKEKNLLIFLFLFSFLIRVPSIFIFGDTGLENEWKNIVNNLTNYGTLSQFNLNNFLVPQVLMPPLYAFYLYFFKLFNFGNETYISVVLISQGILSSFSVVIFYIINKKIFPKKINIIGTLIFSLFPLHIYACGQISSAILQVFLLVSFFYFFFKTIQRNNLFNICLLSLVSGLAILLRGEFIALFLFSILYMLIFFKINLKSTIIIIFLTMLIVSPYVVRNVILFETITITKSFGYNLWKGNNLNSTVDGKLREGDLHSNLVGELKEKIDNVPIDKYYDIRVDKIYLNEGLKNIKNDPLRYLGLYIKKILSFIFIDINSSYPNYYHPLHYLPVLLVGITSILGIIVYKKKLQEINFLILYFLANVAIVSVFFILPRYTLAILPLQIIFSNIFFEYIKNNYLKS